MAAQQNQINQGKENCIPLQGMASYLPFYIIPRYFYSFLQLPNQLMEQRTFFFGCMWMLSGNGCFGTCCTLGYCLVPKTYRMSLSAQISWVGNEYRFKMTKNDQNKYKKSDKHTIVQNYFSDFVSQPKSSRHSGQHKMAHQ